MGADAKLPRTKVSELAAHNLTSFLAHFNNILEKDDVIKASSSPNEVEEALSSLKKSLLESQYALENDMSTWEKKLKIDKMAHQTSDTNSLEAEHRDKESGL